MTWHLTINTAWRWWLVKLQSRREKAFSNIVLSFLGVSLVDVHSILAKTRVKPTESLFSSVQRLTWVFLYSSNIFHLPFTSSNGLCLWHWLVIRAAGQEAATFAVVPFCGDVQSRGVQCWLVIYMKTLWGNEGTGIWSSLMACPSVSSQWMPWRCYWTRLRDYWISIKERNSSSRFMKL